MHVQDVQQAKEHPVSAFQSEQFLGPNGPALAEDPGLSNAMCKSLITESIREDAMDQMTKIAIAIAKRLLEKRDASEISSLPASHDSETTQQPRSSKKQKHHSSSTSNSRPQSSYLPLPHTVPSASQISTPTKRSDSTTSIASRSISHSSSRSRPKSAAVPEAQGLIRASCTARSDFVTDRSAYNTVDDRSHGVLGPNEGLQESWNLLCGPPRSSSRSRLAARPPSARDVPESARNFRSGGIGTSESPLASPGKSSRVSGLGSSSKNGRGSMDLRVDAPCLTAGEFGSGEVARSLSRRSSRGRRQVTSTVSKFSGLDAAASRCVCDAKQGGPNLIGPLPRVPSAPCSARHLSLRPPSSQSGRKVQHQAQPPVLEEDSKQRHEQQTLPSQQGQENIQTPAQQQPQGCQGVADQQLDIEDGVLWHKRADPLQQLQQRQERDSRPAKRGLNSRRNLTPQLSASGFPGTSSSRISGSDAATGGRLDCAASFSSRSDAQTSARSDITAAIRAELALVVAAALPPLSSTDNAIKNGKQDFSGPAANSPIRHSATTVTSADILRDAAEAAKQQRITPGNTPYTDSEPVRAPLEALTGIGNANDLERLAQPMAMTSPLQPQTWAALESQLSAPMLESVAAPTLPVPPTYLRLQLEDPNPMGVPYIQSLPQPPVTNAVRLTETLTPAALAARLQLPRSSRTPAPSSTAGTIATATACPPGGCPLTHQLLRPYSSSDSSQAPTVSSLDNSGPVQRVEVRSSGNGASSSKSPQPLCQDGNKHSHDGTAPLGSCWQQYPGEAGSHPEMVAAVGGTLPLLYGSHWEELMHEIVWRVTRCYGFQTFNLNPETKSDMLPQWTPSTAFLVSEHLCRILVRNILPRMKPPANAMAPNASRLSGADASSSMMGASKSIYSNHRQASAAVNGMTAAATVPPGGVGPVAHVNDSQTSAAYQFFSNLSPGVAPEATATAAGGPRFAMAIYELHNTVFFAYEHRWCPHLDLRPRPRELQRTLEISRWADSVALNGLLSELSLYFLLYSEAANLRHTPELMWFLFWAAVHSPKMEQLWREGFPDVCGEQRGAWGRRIRLRTQLQREIEILQAEVGTPSGNHRQPPLPTQQPPAAVPPDLAAAALPAFSVAVAEALAASAAAAVTTSASPSRLRLAIALSPSDADLLADLAAYGDGGFVTDRVVTPLIYFLSHEMDALFEAGVEVAHRLGYDDVNDSMCSRDVVDRLLHSLGVSEDALVFGGVLDIWCALTELGCRSSAEPPMPGYTVPRPGPFDPQLAANFWSAEVFVKTFRERRSWAAVFRAFFRVYCLQLVLLTLVIAAAFAPGNPGALSSAVVSHAWLAAAERVANWWLSRNPKDPMLVRQQKKSRAEALAAATAPAIANGEEGGMGAGSVKDGTGTTNRSGQGVDISESRNGRFRSGRGKPVGLEASGQASAMFSPVVKAAAALEQGMAKQPVAESPQDARARRRLVRMEGEPLCGGVLGCLDWVLFALALTASYVLYVEDPGGRDALHQLHLGLRQWWLPFSAAYGGVVLLLGVLTTRAGYRVSILSWVPGLRSKLACHSAIPPAGCWLEGYLGVDWKAWAVNVTMWAIIFAVKVTFEYYIMAKPLVAPMRALLNHNFPGCSSWPCRNVSWVLAAFRMLPLCIVCLADTSIIYNAVMALFGILRGLLRLDLGTVASWDELRAAFHRGPVRWWRRCMSAEGVSSHRRALRRHLMEGGQDRAAAEAIVPETPAAPNSTSSGEGSDDSSIGTGEASDGGGGADGDVNNGDEDQHDNDEDQCGSAVTARPSGMGKALGLMWPLRTLGREARWSRERKTLGRIRGSGGASAMAIMELQGVDESQNEMLHAAGRWATVPALSPLCGSSLTGPRRPADVDSMGINVNVINNVAVGEPGQRRRGPIRSSPAPGDSVQRSRRRFSEGGGARLVAEGLELSEWSGIAFRSRRRGGVHGSSRWFGSGDGSAAANASNNRVSVTDRRSRSSGSDGEVFGSRGPVIRAPAKVPDVSGLWQRLPRRSTPADVAQNGNRGSGGGATASRVSCGGVKPATRNWGIRIRQNTVVPLPLSAAQLPEVQEQDPESPGSLPTGARRVVSYCCAVSAAVSGLECQTAPRRPAFSAGPLAEATSTPSTPVGLMRLTRRDAAALALYDQPQSPTSVRGSQCHNLSTEGGRQRDQDYWQQRPLATAAAARLPQPPPRIQQVPPQPESSQTTPQQLQEPKLLTRPSLGSLSDLSTDRAEPVTPGNAILAPSAPGEAQGAPRAQRAPPAPKGGTGAVHRPPWRRVVGSGAETTENDCMMALRQTEDLSLGVLLSRTNGDLAMWDAFATVWDGIVDDLRTADLLSDREAGNLRFMRLGQFQGRHALRPILLPAFFYAGVVQAFVDTGRLGLGGGGAGGGATTTILTELRSLLVWLACELRLLSEMQAEVIMGTSFLHFTTDVDHTNCRSKMFHAGQALVKQLSELCAAVAKHQQKQQELQRQKRHQTAWQQAAVTGVKPRAEKGFSTGVKFSDAANTGNPGRSTSQRQMAAAAAKAFTGAHVDPIGTSLREVLEALAGEARAMRRAVASGRLVSESLAVAIKLEEVAQQVLTDLSTHPDFLSSCLSNLLPRNIIVTPSSAADPGNDASDSPIVSGQRPAVDPSCSTATFNIQTPPPIPSNFAGTNLVTPEVPFIHIRSPVSNRTTEPRAVTNGGASSSPLHSIPQTRVDPTITTAFPNSPITSSSGTAVAGSGVHASLDQVPQVVCVQTPPDFLSGGVRPWVRPDISWGSSTPESAAPATLEPEVALRVRVVEVLVKMLTTPASACRPAGAEALRILGFFVNSLSNPQLKKPPPLSDMSSWSVLTPCYEEDVLYPVSADHAARQLGLAPPPPIGPGRPSDLLSETEDNVSLMSYLRSVFPADWKNFMERLSDMLGGADLSRVTENDFGPMGPLHALAPELQLWATYRGQLLGRTVRGMMCYRRAVRMLVDLEYPRPAGVSVEAYNAWAEALVDCKFQYVCTCQVYGKNRKATDIRRRWLAEGVDSLCLEFPALRVAYLDSAATSYGPTEYSVLLRGNPNHPAALAGVARGVASAEAASVTVEADYGPLAAAGPLPAQPPQPAGQVPRPFFPSRPASAVDDSSKIAKVEEHGGGKGKSGSNSVDLSTMAANGTAATAAANSASNASPTLELYRVRLPHNPFGKRGIILGEGKPENQNHASIFCFGEALQTIDMNQDNALAEALKMRNLLRELAPEPAPRRLQAFASHPRGATTSEHHRQAIAARTAREVPVALVGFREWIFSDVSGALGTFAAACELAFGTIVQRTMSYPGRVRLHYGHPDVFNKMHIMTRGGVSKATRQLHISEDVFGGFNQLLRGGQIKYKEYISCGKGRDMGFDSINAFEIKISGGGGECVVSRDLARLAPRLDLARLLHLYHSGPGYYINSLFIMTAVWLNIWVIAVFALARASTVQRMGPDGALRLEDTLRVEHAISLGPLMLLPYAAQLLLEWGALRTFATLAMQIISGSVAFAVFRQQTTAYYFKDDITYGGARYISTGRGFSITSSSFTTLFTNYARSHLYPGMELLHLIILYASVRDCKGCSFAAATWGTWLVTVALLFSPFWFNPMAFTREKVNRDWSGWLGWMRGEVDISTGNNWHSWNRKQLEKIRNERGTVTDPWLNVASRLMEEVAPRLVLVVAAVSRLDLMIDVRVRALSSPLVPFFAATAIIWLVTLLSWAMQRHFKERSRGRAWRLYRVMMSALVVAVLLSYSVFAVRAFRGPPMSNLALLLYVNSQLVLAVHRTVEQLAPASSAARALVDRGYWLIDWGVGTLLMVFVTVLSWLGFVSRLQTQLLFNSTFAASIRRGKLVRSTGLMKLDEEQRWRNEGQARAELAKSVALSFCRNMAAGVHYGATPLQPVPEGQQPQRD